MRENRKFRRVNLAYRPSVYDAQSNELLGNIVDISAGGFKMIARKKMVQGKEYQLSIFLPESSSDRKRVDVKASVRWCGTGTDVESFSAGCYLLEIEPKDRLDLAALMFSHGSKSEE